jgi:hypothetical protein
MVTIGVTSVTSVTRFRGLLVAQLAQPSTAASHYIGPCSREFRLAIADSGEGYHNHADYMSAHQPYPIHGTNRYDR